MSSYGKRIVDSELEFLLETFGAVLVEGPKSCGKTWTSRQISKSEVMIANPESNYAIRKLAEQDPTLVLNGKFPRMIDEWQEVPAIWDAVRYKVDELGEKSLYILTGSSVPPIGKTVHSGTGRIARLRMRSMTLSEFGDSTGEISFEELVTTDLIPAGINPAKLKDLIHYCIRGGWPNALGMKAKSQHEIPRQYIQSIINEDISRYDNTERDSIKTERLLQSLARNNQTLVSNKTLLADIGNVSENTMLSYKNVLEKLFVLENIPAFSPNIRSKSRLRTSEKVRFVDPSLAIAALHLTEEKLLQDLETFGFLFESLCTRDILSYCVPMHAKVSHYHEAANGTNKENEVDLVIELDDGEYVLIEVKLGVNQIEDAEKSLLHISGKLVRNGEKPPKNMVIVCGTVPYAYTLESGIKVVPVACLKE